MTLSTRVLETAEDLYSLRPLWTSAFETGGSRNPFARWEWTYHWWRFFGRTDGPVRDRLHILLHEDAEGTTHGVTPLVETRFKYGPVSITKLRNVGAVPGANVVEMYPYLWSRDHEVEVARSLAGELYSRRWKYLWAEINTIPLDRPFGHELAESHVGTSGSWLPPTPYFPLLLPDTWTDLKTRLTKNAREYLRQIDVKIGRLVRSGHTCDFDFLEEPDAVLAGLEEFFRLHAARSSMIPDEQDEHFHRNQFASETARQFLRSLARDLAPQRKFSIARLRIDGCTAACRILLPANDEVFLFYSGYDPQWRAHSVMAAVTANCIRRAIDSAGINIANLSTTLDRSKRQWKPEEGHLLGNVRLTGSTLGGRGADLLADKASVLRKLVARRLAARSQTL